MFTLLLLLGFLFSGATAATNSTNATAEVEVYLPGRNYALDLIPVCVNTQTDTNTTDPGPSDVYFLADTTGSMGGAIGNVRVNAANIKAILEANVADVQFGVGEYKDVGDLYVFRNNLAIGPHTSVQVQAAIDLWVAAGGGDLAEAELFALDELAVTPIPAWRAVSNKIVVWFGDAEGHDPSNGVTLPIAIADLKARGVEVIALNVGALDALGQATAITAATGGVYQSVVDVATLSAFILSSLKTQFTKTVSLKPVSNCSDHLVKLDFDKQGLTIVKVNSTICYIPTLISDKANSSAKCNWHVEDATGTVQKQLNPYNITVGPGDFTSRPSKTPTKVPTFIGFTENPTRQPTTTFAPSRKPTYTRKPATARPTYTWKPKTSKPTTAKPSRTPTTRKPTAPTKKPATREPTFTDKPEPVIRK